MRENVNKKSVFSRKSCFYSPPLKFGIIIVWIKSTLNRGIIEQINNKYLKAEIKSAPVMTNQMLDYYAKCKSTKVAPYKQLKTYFELQNARPAALIHTLKYIQKDSKKPGSIWNSRKLPFYEAFYRRFYITWPVLRHVF